MTNEKFEELSALKGLIETYTTDLKILKMLDIENASPNHVARLSELFHNKERAELKKLGDDFFLKVKELVEKRLKEAQDEFSKQ